MHHFSTNEFGIADADADNEKFPLVEIFKDELGLSIGPGFAVVIVRV